jgi:hypothetical protein
MPKFSSLAKLCSIFQNLLPFCQSYYFFPSICPWFSTLS